MIKIFVDSGSSIKQNEKEKLGVEILPLRYLLGETEYEDDIDLDIDGFYDIFIGQDLFPKTSLPNLDKAKQMVEQYTDKGDEVILISISSKISGTYSAFETLFADNDKVYVVDSLSAVGGIRILVHEANKHLDKPAQQVVDMLNKLKMRLKVVAIPETLDYLLKGGRLSKKEWLIGSILKIKPIISLSQTGVKVVDKKIGTKKAMSYLAKSFEAFGFDSNYPIVPSYTYNVQNLEKLISVTDEKYRPYMTEFDNLDPAIACHWGPNAYGYIFVGDDNIL
ncbi:MAG: DegV family EDD domain-containing protein [Clostridia bacterium]|nr:DegV family EDD domain-containing protein [Clostridia bacterium]